MIWSNNFYGSDERLVERDCGFGVRTLSGDLGEVLRAYCSVQAARGRSWAKRKSLVCQTNAGGADWPHLGALPLGPRPFTRPAHLFSDPFVTEFVAALFGEAITWWLEQMVS